MALPIPAYATVLSITGTSTVDASEPCALLSGTNPNASYQVTNTAKRIWDPTVPVVVQDAGTTVPANQYVFNYLFGLVAFVGHTVTGAITVAGNYLPVIPVVLANKIDLTVKLTTVDTSQFDGTGAVERVGTIFEAEGSLSGFDVLNTVLDGGTLTWQSILQGSLIKVLTYNPGSGNYFRCFITVESEKTSGSIQGVLEGAVNFKSVVGGGLTSYGWGQ